MYAINIIAKLLKTGKVESAVISGHVKIADSRCYICNRPFFTSFQIINVNVINTGPVASIEEVGLGVGINRIIFVSRTLCNSEEIGAIPLDRENIQLVKGIPVYLKIAIVPEGLSRVLLRMLREVHFRMKSKGVLQNRRYEIRKS